jgi:hypothetical protein
MPREGQAARGSAQDACVQPAHVVHSRILHHPPQLLLRMT